MEHGTATGWRHHRCRCDACHRALLAEAKVVWALRQVRQGRDPATRVPAGQVRGRVAELEAAGLTRGAIAARAGVSAGTISRIAKPTTRRVSRIVATAVMSLPTSNGEQHVESSGWLAEAACRGRSALFFAEDRGSQEIAVAVCRSCPVRMQCAVETRKLEGASYYRSGVRAGLTPAERRPATDSCLSAENALEESPVPARTVIGD